MRDSLTGKGRNSIRAATLAMAVLFGWADVCSAQGINDLTKVDINALTQETQKMSQRAEEITFVWWIPNEYWETSFSQDPKTSNAQAGEVLKVLRPYTVLLVVDGKMGPFGGITYDSKEAIKAGISIKDAEGVSYPPINEEEVDFDTKNFLSMMKPVFANMLGPMGQNMHFFLFPDRNNRGQRIAEAGREGSLLVKLGSKEFKWRLPLGSLLPAKLCPTCGEKLSGAYKFCPWDGTKL
ncbi:MAG: hypothetical protein ABIH40_02455 [Candidatus Omnitrophota bacterium]